MIIGIPCEVKSDEYRVSMLPVGVMELVKAGHEVFIETNAGIGSGYDDQQYQAVGAKISSTHEEVFAKADMIIKVKEPLATEWPLMRESQIIFTYFHFAANKALTQACLDSGITAVAYETLTDKQSKLPLLTPMSEIAGRMAIQEGAKYLETPMQGRGVLLGGVPGVEPGEVLVLGAGVVGTNAARMAAGLGARVVIMDINLDRLRYLEEVMPANVTTVYCDDHAIEAHAKRADLIIGAVLVPGGKTPQLIRRNMLASLKPGAVIVDVGVDQGGCVETTHPTTHQNPTYLVDGIVHYCVANMPGAVGRTSTQALCHATQPYVLKLAQNDLGLLLKNDAGFTNALNIRQGQFCNAAVEAAYYAN